jgi:hemerythrin-like domain-containing protein
MEAMDFKSYKLQMNYMANGIIGILREHIYLENQSVFPNALNVIKDESTWSELKDEFDEIGYYFEKMMLL